MSTQFYLPQESVYDLLPKEEQKPEKPTRYVSKFRPTVVQEEKLPKRPMRTMGPAKVEVPSPEKFLKKHSKEPRLPDKPQSAKEGPKPKPISVDNHTGHKEVLENSGLVPKYIKKTDFGKVPTYLQHREKQAMKQLSEEERQDILEGLKKNWDRLHHEYQGQSLVIDTWSKRAHKERLEADMKRLEKDIEMFERFKIIYIADN
ncbi:hypothetical protein WMY93_029970 [Mugilogobius chulae]|uniref:Enkurin domain-containing protein n=1 Tax=Mugilogobius chulae TaxID=88201 RepID=A0AAW0MSQ4_9GOBI